MDERPEPSSPVLVKEVATPLPRQSGLAALVVASVAMLFAVSSAAFLLRARMAVEACPHAQARAVPGAALTDSPTQRREAAPGTACGEAVYETAPDGSTIITFDLCDQPQPRVKELEGIEIKAIHRSR